MLKHTEKPAFKHITELVKTNVMTHFQLIQVGYSALMWAASAEPPLA